MTPTLFDAPPPARATDPATTQTAALMPHLPAQRLAVLTALVSLGTATPWDIVARLNGPESGTVRSRLSQLAAARLAHKVGQAPGTRGAPNTLWAATDTGRVLVAEIGGPS